MAALGDTHPYRLTFCIFSVLIVTNIALVAYNVAKSDITSDGLQSGTPYASPSVQTIFGQLVHKTGIPQGTAKLAAFASKTVSHSMKDTGDVIFGTTHFVSDTSRTSLYTMVHAEDDVINFASNATDVNTYIKPVPQAKTPVITPMSTVAIVKAIAAVSPPASPVMKQATTIQTIIASSSIPASDITNTYAWGNCTYWTAIERARVGDPIPNTWGNAATWAIRAEYDGYVVNHTPSPGSIMQTANSAGGLGHVAFVTSVDSDGTWHISEMNAIGLDKVDERTMSAAAAAYYYFIHDKN